MFTQSRLYHGKMIFGRLFASVSPVANVTIISLLLPLPAGVVVAQRSFAQQREAMVGRYIVPAGITDERVLNAMRATPRHQFVPENVRGQAYLDVALPIGSGQTISSPYIVAMMTARIDPQPTDRVLEVGTGSGYQAAVLSPLVNAVYTVEIVPELGNHAATQLKQMGYENVFVRVGDGYQGWPDKAPFQKIIVTCSPEEIPNPLVEQLAEGGSLVIPTGERFQQTLYRFTKIDGRLKQERLEATFFVPMTGQAETQRKVMPDATQPQIVNGSFEDVHDESGEPLGWYYLRRAKVVPDTSAPNGRRCISFLADDPSRGAHALQSFGVDGRKVGQIQVELRSQGHGVRTGLFSVQSAQLVVEFYDQNRAAVKLADIPAKKGTYPWAKHSATIEVPPDARVAVLGIGLLGAAGELSIDTVSLTAQPRKPSNTE